MPDPSPPPPAGLAVVLPVPAAVAARVALPGGLPASELHVTLAYLPAFPAGDAAAYARLRAAVAVWALLGCAPLPATLGGVGRFVGTPEDGDAFHLTADVPGLPAIRETLVKVLAAQGFEVSTAHGFSPHVTLAYLAPDAPSPFDRVDPVPLVFDRVSLWQGAQHDDVLFRPPPVATLHTTGDAALEAAVPARYADVDFTPPQGVRDACRRGVELHEAGQTGDGLEPATVAWARRLAAGEAVSPAKARQMRAFFDRNPRFADEPKDSAAWASWQLWGGHAGNAWSRKLVDQMNTRDLTLTAAAYGAAVELSVPPTDGTGGPWCVLAYEVELKGYRYADGTHAKITASDIDQMIANFGRYPKVPLVFEHADTREGMPPEWATPKGFVVALRKGTMARTVGGKIVTVATLEGRLDVSEDMRLAIVGDREKGIVAQWPFCSITTAKGTNEETGEAVGTVLWSVSLTAHPRLADLPRLAASKEPTMNGTKTPATPTAPKRTELSCWYGEIKVREDVLAMLRHCLNLPVSTTETEVLAALDAAVALAATDGSVGDAIEDVREAMRLPVVNADGAAPDLAAEVRKALSALPGASTSNTEMSRGAPAATPALKEGTTMKTFLELAAELKVPAATEDAARDGLLALARDGQSARQALKLADGAPLAPALGEVASDRAELAQVKAAHATATAELAQIKADAEKARKESAEKALREHVDAVALAKGWDDDTRALVFAGALVDPEAFAKKHPKPSVQELGQRAQDGQRFARLPGANGAPPPAPDASATATVQQEIEALQAFAADHGESLSTLEAFALVNQGETVQSYAARLGVRAA